MAPGSSVRTGGPSLVPANSRVAARSREARRSRIKFDIEDAGWQERALCAQTDPEAFFPEKGGSTREAKRVCLTCDVRDECLEYALQHDERFGIWGGLSPNERRKVRRQHDRAA